MDDEKPTRPYTPRKPRHLTPIPEDAKLFPESLRELLNQIRETARPDGGPLSHSDYLRRLNATWKGPRYGVKRITRSIFETTEDGDAGLAYWKLEAYAREVGVPSSLILLVSRIASELRESSDLDGASDVLEGMRRAIDELGTQANDRKLDIRRVFGAYLAG